MKRIARHRKGPWIPDCLKLQQLSENVTEQARSFHDHLQLHSAGTEEQARKVAEQHRNNGLGE